MLQTMMVDNLTQVRTQPVQNCLICSLCSNLLIEATTICVCLHTFCRECIYQKFENDETNCCPVCNVYLGSCPEEKLRPDNNLQDLRMKVFPVKKPRDLESKSTKPTLTKRKERSLSSLAKSATRSIIRPKKPPTRAATRNSSRSKNVKNKLCDERNVKGVIKNIGSSSSHKGLNKLSTISKKQRISGNKEKSQNANIAFGLQNNPECSLNMQDKGLEWEGLSVLAETAHRAENSNMASLDLPAFNDNINCLPIKNTKRLKRSAREQKFGQSSTNVNVDHNSVNDKRTSPRSDGGLNISESMEQRIESSNANESSENSLRRKRNPYPQIPKRYIRIKDSSAPVSSICKYLVQKLSLRHESEVEVMCRGQVAPPDATLSDLLDIWVHSESNMDPSSDPHDFVMVLTYRRSQEKQSTI